MDRPSRIAALLCAISLSTAGCATGGRSAWPEFASRGDRPEPTFAKDDDETKSRSSKPTGTKSKSDSRSAQAAPQKSATKSGSASKKDESPFVASKDRAAKSRPASENASSKTEANDAPRAKSTSGANAESLAKTSSKAGPLDAETTALIEAELRDAPAAERTALRKDLESLDPATIRLILGNRRMVQRYAQNGTDKGAPIVQTSAALEGDAGAGRAAFATDATLAGTTGHSSVPGSSSAVPTATAAPVPTGHSSPHAAPSPHASPTGLDAGPSIAAGSADFRPQSATTGLGTVSPWGQPAPQSTAAATAGTNPWSNTAPTGSPVATPSGGGTAPPTGLAGPSPWDRFGQPAQNPAAPQGSATMPQPITAPGPTSGPQGFAAGGPQFGAPGSSSQSTWPPATQTVGYGPDPRAAASVFGEIPAASNGTPGANGIEGFAASPEMQRVLATAAAEAARLAPGATDAQREEHVRRQVHLRMLYLVSGQNHRALEAIPGIEPADQEFWQQVFWGIANYFDREAIADPRDRAGQTIAQLRTAVMRLQEKARLELRNVNFCRRIQSYGTYDRFERDEFAPGQPVLIYAEVANFKSEATAEGQYRTLLKSTVEIYRAGTQGELVERIPFSATEDLCRNHRRDYFHSYEFAIPQRLSLGPHVLKLVVEDQLSRKVSTATANFTVK